MILFVSADSDPRVFEADFTGEGSGAQNDAGARPRRGPRGPGRRPPAAPPQPAPPPPPPPDR